MTQFKRNGLFTALDGGAFAARDAIVTGDVTLGVDVGIWFGCVLRGTCADRRRRAYRTAGPPMIHADTDIPNVIGSEVTIGHRCVLHGSRVGDRALIGMGAVLLSGSQIGEGALVAAGAVVREGFVVPPRTLVAGVPAKIVRPLSDEEVARILESAEGYVKKIRLYL
jgi:carbonic anhydrase/acetyltransferase-like protein (isoleucine patch superfamily)